MTSTPIPCETLAQPLICAKKELSSPSRNPPHFCVCAHKYVFVLKDPHSQNIYCFRGIKGTHISSISFFFSPLEWGEFHLPIHTSPNWPLPSFFTSFRASRGISHSSWAQGLWGTRDVQGAVRRWHSPSPFSARGQSTAQLTGMPQKTSSSTHTCQEKSTHGNLHKHTGKWWSPQPWRD